MAEQHESKGFFRDGAALLSNVYSAVMEGGEVQAAVRQGFRELGNAFGQFWPDQIAVTEPGAVFSPLHSDIAAERDGYAQTVGLESLGNLPSPATIAQSVSPVRAVESAEPGHRPSPSEIAQDQRSIGNQPEPQRDQQLGHDR